MEVISEFSEICTCKIRNFANGGGNFTKFYSFKISKKLHFYVLSLFCSILCNKKQPSRGVLRKRCSEYAANLHPWPRRTPMPKCDFNKVALDVLLKICCIFSEHLFLRTHLKGCLFILKSKFSNCSSEKLFFLPFFVFYCSSCHLYILRNTCLIITDVGVKCSVILYSLLKLFVKT